MKTSKLYLLPMPLSEESPEVLHPQVVKLWHQIDTYFVEEVKAVRRTMKKLDRSIDIDRMQFYLINKHTVADLDAFDQCVLEGKDMALMSDTGTPAVADPGSSLVMYAHDRGVRVVPIVAPSSILMALESSGMNGNRFSFRGYLDIDKNQRKHQLKEIENRVLEHNETTLVMDAPYRNNQLLASIIQNLHPSLGLCIATEITSPQETIKTKAIADWKKQKLDLHKKKVMFVIGQFPK